MGNRVEHPTDKRGGTWVRVNSTTGFNTRWFYGSSWVMIGDRFYYLRRVDHVGSRLLIYDFKGPPPIPPSERVVWMPPTDGKP